MIFSMCRLVATQGLSLNGSRTIAPEENCPSPRTPKLTLTQPLTLTGEQFSWGCGKGQLRGGVYIVHGEMQYLKSFSDQYFKLSNYYITRSYNVRTLTNTDSHYKSWLHIWLLILLLSKITPSVTNGKCK